MLCIVLSCCLCWLLDGSVGVVRAYVTFQCSVDAAVDFVEFRRVSWQVEGFDLCSVGFQEQGCGFALVEAGVVHDEDELPVALAFDVA